jgi:hypothetical protein
MASSRWISFSPTRSSFPVHLLFNSHAPSMTRLMLGDISPDAVKEPGGGEQASLPPDLTFSQSAASFASLRILCPASGWLRLACKIIVPLPL